MSQKRFSALQFSHEMKLKSNAALQDAKIETEISRQGEFELCVEEVRSYLVNSKGKTEEETRQYSESLNRAILGFESERAQFLAMINDYLAKRRIHELITLNGQFSTLAEAIFAEVIGLNVLELILKNKDGLEEVQVVGTRIFEIRNGKAAASHFQFRSIKELERIQQNLVLFNNDSINPRKKWAEVRLQDGSRVTLTGFGFTSQPTLTIRFYTVKYFSLESLCHPDYSTIDVKIAAIIRCLILSYFNFVIIGPTNSGKTNLIKAMIAEMPEHERIITLESRFELMLKRDFPSKNLIEYEYDEHDGTHSSEQAFKLALRQSPRRICLAEIRDEDANIYVRACTRGHEGSLTTVHVNDLEDGPDAITDMCMLDRRGMDPERLRKRITEYVTQIGIQMGIVNGKRKVVRIGEYVYLEGEVRVRDIVRFDYTQQSWNFPSPLSVRVLKAIERHDPAGYRRLVQLGVTNEC